MRGLRHGQQRLKVFGMAGAHFHDGQLCILPYPEHRERHSDVVVQVAFGGIYAVFGGQDGTDKLLGGGFPVGAREADYRDIQLPAVPGGQLLQGCQGIRHFDESGIFGAQLVAYYCPAGTGLKGLHDKAVAVKVFPFQGKEQLPFLKGTGVRIDARGLLENAV